MKKRVCDLCEERTPDAKIKYRYKAKRRWFLWYEEGWNRIELCEDCLMKIINAKEYKLSVSEDKAESEDK